MKLSFSGIVMKKFVLVLIALVLTTVQAHAARIKDVAQVAGVRSNQLVGYGLVTGLPGTGESTPFTDQSFNAMLQNFGIQLPPGTKPKQEMLPLLWSRQKFQRLPSKARRLTSRYLLSAQPKACVVVL
ncbi:flagellar P-ring protein FlgI [Vibrio astriarenae]|nr:flagellar P-ring protein FlgI [Vibrio sp. C7]